MKKFKKDNFVDCGILKRDEIINFENHFLKVVLEDVSIDNCEECFFNKETYECSNLNMACIKSKYGVAYKEIDPIEGLILGKE